ncbi:hypothetical protein KDW_40090 [Dictyobacter vulcani]|uniref:IstB-like ATP-binding domain-containing protein n=1 Tax=Dictyobacter vulcani TaxID=2607529 RepID=A0A5J4KTU0_9CHLR|nr:ATP-binding protein [Dictyobacter vulcani]GER89847.1 hypothetical protein KDW_40090 [Dictyobacter vulcani]
MQPSGQNQDHQALLESHLRTLNLPAFLQLYQAYARDAARNGLSPEQFLLGLCEAEVADRDAKRIESAIRRARFPFIKELADYDFTAVENIPKTAILELAQGGIHESCGKPHPRRKSGIGENASRNWPRSRGLPTRQTHSFLQSGRLNE